MAKGNKGFGSSLTEGLDGHALPSAEGASESVMASRTRSLARIAAGKVVTDRTEWVDPDRCRPWRLHNRDLDHLNEETCRDLIDAFLSAKRQRIPAIVRRLRDDPDYDYEIVAGVRRWWTVRWLRSHHHPDFEYLVTVQNFTDEEAFRVSDIENRSRKDITDWERAKEYARALAEFYNGSLGEMASHLNISKSWLSRLLDVARLPQPIVAAFPDTHLITVRIARDLKPLANDPASRALMIDEADRIASERKQGRVVLTGPEIAKRLIAATTITKRRTIKQEEVCNDNGHVLFRYVRSPNGALSLKIPERNEVPIEEIVVAIERLLSSK